MVEEFSQVGLLLRFPSGVPNLPQSSAATGYPDHRDGAGRPLGRRDAAELAQIHWSWPGPKGQPAFNFRSEGREFSSGRCLIPADGFYEFTGPPEESPKGTRKTNWLFTMEDERWFCIAGTWRKSDAGDAFAMLTTAPGPDVAPIHDRQIVVLGRIDWARWLDTRVPAAELLRPAPAGKLRSEAITAG